MVSVGDCYVGRAIPVSSREFLTKVSIDEAVWHALYCFTLCHRFGGGSKVYVTRLPTEIANMIRRYLRMAVRADVETAITSVIDCYFGECNCSTKTSAEMRQHRRAEIVYDQISDDERWFSRKYDHLYLRTCCNEELTFILLDNPFLYDVNRGTSQLIARLDSISLGTLQGMQKDELLYPLKKLALEPARLQDYDYTWDKTCCMVGADGLELPDKEDEARHVYAEPGLYLLHELQRTCSSRALVTKYGEQFHAIRDGPYLRGKENETGPSNNGDGGGGDLTGHSDRAMFQAGKNVTIVSMLSWFL